jgi:hypothetical protein
MPYGMPYVMGAPAQAWRRRCQAWGHCCATYWPGAKVGARGPFQSLTSIARWRWLAPA